MEDLIDIRHCRTEALEALNTKTFSRHATERRVDRGWRTLQASLHSFWKKIESVSPGFSWTQCSFLNTGRALPSLAITPFRRSPLNGIVNAVKWYVCRSIAWNIAHYAAQCKALFALDPSLSLSLSLSTRSIMFHRLGPLSGAFYGECLWHCLDISVTRHFLSDPSAHQFCRRSQTQSSVPAQPQPQMYNQDLNQPLHAHRCSRQACPRPLAPPDEGWLMCSNAL